MGAFKRIHPLPPALPRRCVMRSQCDRCCLRFMPVLMDPAARSPFHKKGARRGPRARQCASAAPHGNLPCGAALAHWPLLDSNRMGAHTAMCAGRVLVLLSRLLLLSLLTSATEGVDMFMRLGVCVSVWLPIGLAHSSVLVDLDGIPSRACRDWQFASICPVE